MATVKFIKNSRQSAGGLKYAIEYCTREAKTLSKDGKSLITGINCDGNNAYNEMMLTKKAFPSQNCNKQKDRFFYQYAQSFSPQEKVTPEQVHQIGLEFAQRAWPNQEILVTTHMDANHLHNHFIISGVDLETGKRLRQNPNTLKKLRDLSDEICKAHNLNVLKPYEKSKMKGVSSGQYRAAVNGNSWVFKLMGDIDYVMQLAKDKEHFINLMNELGYDVLWSDDRKYITYSIKGTNLKCRDIRLHEEKYLKENMENEFKLRQSQEQEFNSSTSADSRSNGHSSGQGSMGRTANNTGYEFADDRFQQSGSNGQGKQPISESIGNTGWESERQDYYNGQRRQTQDEGLDVKDSRDNVSDTDHQQSNISRLDVPSSGIIDEESDDPELRERQRRAKQNADAFAEGLQLAAELIEDAKQNRTTNPTDDYDEDDDQGWGPTMDGM